MRTSTLINFAFLLILLLAITSCQKEEITVINELDLIEKSDKLEAVYIYMMQYENMTREPSFSSPVTSGNGSDTVLLYLLPDSSFVNYRTYQFNDKGHIIKTNVFDEDDQLISTNERELSYWPNGQLKTVINNSSETTFNEQGDFVDLKHYDNEGNLQYHTTYSYTYQNGLKVKSVKEDKKIPMAENIPGVTFQKPAPNGVVETKYIYNFGKLVKSINYVDGKATSSSVQSYDKYGYLSESKFYYQGEFSGSRKLDYNKNGVLLGEYTYGGDGALQMEIRYSYKQ